MADDEKFDGVMLNLATQLDGGVPEFQSTSSKYRKSYSYADLQRALALVQQKHMAVQTAADMCGIPESTLRDRVKGKVKQGTTKSGPPPVLAAEDEGLLVEYLHQLCSFGYSYSRTDIINLATDYAIILGKRDPTDWLTHQWYYKFLERWPGLEINRASSTKKQFEKATSVDSLSRYFVHLQELIDKYNLSNKPDSIFMIDEVLIELDKSPPGLTSWKHFMKFEKCQKRNSILPSMTVIASGNASGARLPAFFIFPGKTVSSESIEDCSPGTGATCSDDGLTNCNVFQLYLENHFLKFIERKDEEEAILVLFDGHRTFMSPAIVDMYKTQNVHLVPIPPSGSQCLSSLDKGIFGDIKTIFDRESDAFMETEVEKSIHSNICVVASNAYNDAVSSDTLKNTFKRYGLWPFKPQIVNKRIDLNTAPPEPPSLRSEKMIIIPPSLIRSKRKRTQKTDSNFVNMDTLQTQLMSTRRKKKMLPTKRLNYSGRKQSAEFLARKREREHEKKMSLKMKFVRDMSSVGSVSKKGRKRRSIMNRRTRNDSDFETDSDYEIDEMLSSEEDEDEDNNQENAQRTVDIAVQREHFESALRNELLSSHGLYFEGTQREKFEREFERVKQETGNKETVITEEVVEEAVLDQNQVHAQIVELDGTISSQTVVQQIVYGDVIQQTVPTEEERNHSVIYTEEPSTSVEKVETGPTVVIETVQEEIPETEMCCVCKKFYPEAGRDGYVLEFCTWGKCDYEGCFHWTHLKYCCDVKVLRRHDIFYCPCHNQV